MEPGSKDVRCLVDRPYAFVGDLHGRVNLLRTILERDTDRHYHYVFLGDTIHHKNFFQRNRRCSPVKVLQILDATNLEATGVYYTDRDESVVYY